MSEVKNTARDRAGIAKLIAENDEKTIKTLVDKIRASQNSLETLRIAFLAKKKEFLDNLALKEKQERRRRKNRDFEM